MTDSILKEVVWAGLPEPLRRAALERPAVRSGADIGASAARIIAAVRRDGDAALLRFAEEFDGVRPQSIQVSEEEARAAEARVPDAARTAIAVAIANITRFHEATRTSATVRVETADGVACERVVRPLSAVGLYVPAGSAPLPSTAMMLAVPARIAGCPVRVLCTPPTRDGGADPAVIYVARACGITRIFKVGGAQAVAALAYGTASIPKVDKIFGPGNAWVTAAKQQVAADPLGAALDMPAGPSEVMVIADESAQPRFVAMDLLSQAEHGPDSQVILASTSVALVADVRREIELALSELPRRDIIRQALRHSTAVLVASANEAVAVANRYAPEHLILQIRNARSLVDLIQSAGSVFVGPWTPESVGDYCSGTNHVLPTYGYARTYSGLSVADFERRMTVQELTLPGLRGLAPTVTSLATLEGLDAHAAAVRVRLEAGAT